MPSARRLAVPLTVVLLLLAFPLATTGFYLEFTAKVMILAIFALSLELLVGATGLVSLGHAAFYGIAAYATVLLSPKYGAASLFWLLPAALACSALYAFLVGALSLRTRGVYFIMVTLAFAQMAYYVFHDTKLGGGTDGIYLNFKPEVALFGMRSSIWASRSRSTTSCWRACAGVPVPRGVAEEPLRPRAGRHQEQRTADARGWIRDVSVQVAAFTLAGALAGLAGFLVAVRTDSSIRKCCPGMNPAPSC